MDINQYQTIKPEYEHLVRQYEKMILDLNQMVLDKYNKIEYHAVKVYRPSEWSRMVHIETLQVTEGVRNLYAEILMLATENVIVVKF